MRLKKLRILDACKGRLRDRIESLGRSIADLQLSMESESRSSAGDKHETGRARMQAEMDKLGRQLETLREQLNELERLSLENTAAGAFSGSIVETNQGCFFISTALGRVTVDDEEVMAVSPASPIGQVLSGLEKHAEFHLNGRQFRVLDVY